MVEETAPHGQRAQRNKYGLHRRRTRRHRFRYGVRLGLPRTVGPGWARGDSSQDLRHAVRCRSDRGSGGMASSRLSGFASAFDDMLERSRREMDALSGGPGLRQSRRAGEGRAPRAPRAEIVASPLPSRSPAERALDEKLGPGWRYEVVERIREDGETVVRCRIHAPARGITRTVYGSASPSGSGAGSSGTAGGISFRLGEGRPPAGTGAVPAERDAERRPVDSALAACARLL